MFNNRILGLNGTLSAKLPSNDETLLLRGCLLSDETAHDAWNNWLVRIGDPKQFFETNSAGIKGLLPFIASSLRRNEISVDNELRTYLHFAYVRERLRNKIYQDILRKVLSVFDTSNIPNLALKGCALSTIVYKDPVSRHNHAIDLLLKEQDLVKAGKVLMHFGFSRSGGHAREDDSHKQFTHDSGLLLCLHSRLFYIPHYQAPLTDTWHQSSPRKIAGVDTRILSPEDNLVHTCGHASYSRHRSNLRWVCDAWNIIDHFHDLQWEKVLERSVQCRLSPSLNVMLSYLHNELEALIPSTFLEELASSIYHLDAKGHEAIIAATVIGARSPDVVYRQIGGNWRGRIKLLKFALLPSNEYVRWRHRVKHSWQLPLIYIFRPFRLILRYVQKLCLRSAQLTRT